MKAPDPRTLLLLGLVGSTVLIGWCLRQPAAARAVVEAQAPVQAVPVVEAPGGTPPAQPEALRLDGERRTVSRPAQGSPPGPRLELALVRADTREPVPGAELWCWSVASDGAADFDERLRSGRLTSHLATLPVRRADSNGRALLPADAPRLEVVARAGDLWGHAAFPGEHPGPFELALVPDADVLVRVLDPHGAPVSGAGVVLLEQRGAARRERLCAFTGADGLARLEHAGWLLAESRTSTNLLVALAGLRTSPEPRRLTRPEAPGEPLEFVLAPSGTCVVTLVDERGEIQRLPFQASLSLAEARPLDLESLALVQATSVLGEPLAFEQIEPGHELVVRVQPSGRAPCELRARGPRLAGERVELRVPLPTGPARLRGRLVDEDGTPLPDLALRALLEPASSDGPAPEPTSLRTGPDGRFSLELAALPEEPGWTLTLHGRDSPDGASARCRLFPWSSDLGDLRFQSAPLLCAGVVLDEQGEPVAGARIEAWPPGASGPSFPACAETRSSANGTFELRGAGLEARLVLAVHKEDLLAEPELVPRGTRDLRVVLRAGGEIEGRVQVDPSLRGAVLLIEARRSGDDAQPPGAPPSTSLRLGADGTFLLRALASGSYDLSVVHAASAAVLGGVRGIAVRAGARTRDPRLAPLDLGTALRALELELVDTAGVPVAGGRASSRPSGALDGPWTTSIAEHGRVQLVGDGRALDVVLVAPGFQRLELSGVAASRRVTLRRAPELRFVLAPGLALPEAPEYLGLQLTPLDPAPLASPESSGLEFFLRDGTLVVRPPFAGDVRLDLALLRRDGASTPMAYLPGATPRTLTIADVDGEQWFELAFDPAMLVAARAELR